MLGGGDQNGASEAIEVGASKRLHDVPIIVRDDPFQRWYGPRGSLVLVALVALVALVCVSPECSPSRSANPLRDL